MTAPDKPSRPHDADLALATRELRAARAIVLDPTCDDDLAAGHLLRAWQALARVAGVELGADARAVLRPEDRAVMPPRAVVEAGEVLPAVLAAASPAPPAWTVPHAVLERHCDGLAVLLAARHRPPRRVGGRKLLLGLSLGAAAVAAAVLLSRPWNSPQVGSWAATYYNRPDFTGQSVQRRDRDVNFEWKEKPPMDSIPADRYSVRWDTCLTLDKDQDVAFQLVSDDGSRLFVDGKQIVDNWGKHGVKAKGRSINLKAGVRHLRVEYFEHRNDATVALSASFGPDKPGPIPSSMLHVPPGDQTDENPCDPQ
ncbi:MAG: hypothetical protein JNL82_39035 [Myxococcales bacterium]|nr:hypothetical protein [Myxococcales bacterium]